MLRDHAAIVNKTDVKAQPSGEKIAGVTEVVTLKAYLHRYHTISGHQGR
jgi:hypothetical protein